MTLRNVEDVVRLIRDEISYRHEIAEVAADAGVCYQTVANLANGKTKSPHFRTAICILKAMGYNVQLKGQRGMRTPPRRRGRPRGRRSTVAV